jgi:deoxycytidine triphosphate deaminase
MLHNPKDVVERKLITGTYSVQPNAIDFSLDELYRIEPSMAYLSNNKKLVQHRTRSKVSLITPEAIVSNSSHTFDNAYEHPDLYMNEGWFLEPNTSYDGMSNVYVEIPEGLAAFLVVRSTFNRNAILLTSGLYDSGFKGNIGFALHTKSGYTFIEKGTYVGQVIFVDSENAGVYSGGYNTKDGVHWTDATGTPSPKEEPTINAPVSEVVPAPMRTKTTETVEKRTKRTTK